ncbi:hypothetical protein WJX72_000921 [[Myrmecia] bisecta]|uniref:Mitochondrial carrier protein n=1 Tax=[Myrmecia] bisecta TaxID=41462 RepID=A0AAW1Q0R2_9CHLO
MGSEDAGKVLQLPVFVRELLAGGVAGGLGKTCVAPLERTKILFQTGQVTGQGIFQTVSLLARNEGIPGLFKGNGASVLRIVPYAAIHFGAYEYYRQLLVDALLAPSSNPHRRAEGLGGLYRGIGPTLCGILPYAGLKFYTYQSLKQQWVISGKGYQEHDLPQRLPVPLMLTFGACSGLVAQTATYPLDVVRRQMQVQSLRRSATPYTSTWHGLRLIARSQGWRALFTGLSINYMKVVPSTAIGFTVYDAMKATLLLPNHL